MIKESVFWVGLVASVLVAALMPWFVFSLRGTGRGWVAKLVRALAIIVAVPSLFAFTMLLLGFLLGKGTMIAPPVRFIPEKLVVAESGARKLLVINEGDTGIVLRVDYATDSRTAYAEGEDTIYLLPKEEQEVEVTVRVYDGVPAVIAPKPERWEEAIRAPSSVKARLPKVVKRGEWQGYEAAWVGSGTDTVFYYLNESNSTLWVWPETILGPGATGVHAEVHTDWHGETCRVEPGEGCCTC